MFFKELIILDKSCLSAKTKVYRTGYSLNNSSFFETEKGLEKKNMTWNYWRAKQVDELSRVYCMLFKVRIETCYHQILPRVIHVSAEEMNYFVLTTFVSPFWAVGESIT